MKTLAFTVTMACASSVLAQDRTLESNWAGSRDADLGSEVSALDADTPVLDDPSVSAPIPTTPPPVEKPAPTPVPAPPAPRDQAGPEASAVAPEVPAGQWVYTHQYGWVYAPYAQAYTYVPPDASTAQMFVWRVGVGWAWLLSPWVFSLGPRPYWGAYGPRYFAWHARPWFRPHVVQPAGPRFAPYRRIGPGPFHARPHGGPLGPRRWR